VLGSCGAASSGGSWRRAGELQQQSWAGVVAAGCECWFISDCVLTWSGHWVDQLLLGWCASFVHEHACMPHPFAMGAVAAYNCAVL
jgi:hypothetical protein